MPAWPSSARIPTSRPSISRRPTAFTRARDRGHARTASTSSSRSRWRSPLEEADRYGRRRRARTASSCWPATRAASASGTARCAASSFPASSAGCARSMSCAYTDWMLRPRTPDELDPNQGGGIVFRQGPHQIDTFRVLGGGMLRSVRGMTGQWMRRASGPGLLHRLHGVRGRHGRNDHAQRLRLLRDGRRTIRGSREAQYTEADRAALRTALRQELARRRVKEKQEYRVGGSAIRPRPAKPVRIPGSRSIWVRSKLSCERGIIRPAQLGLSRLRRRRPARHRPHAPLAAGARPLGRALARGPRGVARGGRLRPADVSQRPWGRATLEAILAVIDSARERREIILERQVAMPDEYDADLNVGELSWQSA